MDNPTVSEKKSKAAPKRAPYTAQRVKHETKKRIKAMLVQVNRKDFGEQIHGDALVALAISLLTPEHLAKLQDASLSHADRLRRDYRAYTAKHGPLDEDAYLGRRLSGEISAENEPKSDANLVDENS